MTEWIKKKFHLSTSLDFHPSHQWWTKDRYFLESDPSAARITS